MPDIVIVSESGTLTVVEGSGTVYGLSIVSANGFAGSVAKDSTLPAITLSTTVTGIVKGNGTKISAATAGTDFVLPGGALGTPSSGTLTLCTGLPISTGVSGLGTGAATFLATPSSANLIALLTDETGTGAAVFANTPTLVTPNIGVATGTSLTLSGDLVVNGSTVTLNATTLDIKDKNITLANVVTPTEITCDGAGITVKSSVTDHTLNYVASTTAWTSSENIDLASGKVIKFNGVSVLSATALNKVTVTAPATGATLTIVDGATLTASATASVSGTNTGDNAVNTLYSSLITDKTVVLANGTGISITGTYPSFTVANSLPDQTVVLTAGSGVGITGTYPSFTISATGSGGTVTTASVVSANGFAGTVATATSTPAITISTSITGLLKGNGTAISAATSGTDYAIPSGNITGTAAGLSATLAVASGGTGVTTSTGSGANALATSPVLVTPTIGVAAATSINKVAITQPATGSTLTIVDGATLTASATASVSNTNTGDNAINSLYSSLISDKTVVLTNGTGISVTGTYPSFTVTNSAPDQTVALTAGSGVGITGTYPSFTITATGSGGTVTTASVVSANGFAGSVANATSTPAITISTSITGLLKGNGTAISAATAGTDYLVPAGALGTPSSGNLTNCTFPILNQNTNGSAASLSNVLGVTSGGTGLGNLASNNVILGAGTSSPTFVAPSTSGNVLTSNGTTWTSAAPTGGGSTDPIFHPFLLGGM